MFMHLRDIGTQNKKAGRGFAELICHPTLTHRLETTYVHKTHQEAKPTWPWQTG